MRRLSALVCAIAATTTVAVAQETMSLTLEQAVAIAMERNQELERARLDIQKADAQVDNAMAGAYPSLNFNTRYTYNIQRPVLYVPLGEGGAIKAVEFGEKQALAADLTLNQTVFNSAVFNGIGTAETYAKVSRQQLRTRTSETVLTVKRAYYGAVLAKQYLQVSETLLNNAEETYKNAQTLYKAGLRAEFDAIRAEVQVANQKPAVVQARDSYAQALEGLRLVLGLPHDQDVEIAETLIRPASLAKVEPEVDEAMKVLEEYNPQIRSLTLADEVNDQLIEINRSDYLPTLSLFGAYQYSAQSADLGKMQFQPSSYLGLNLSLNILNGGRTKAQVEQAMVEKEQSRLQLDQATNGLKTQLENVLRKIDYARKRIESSEHTIAQADKGYKIATATYKAGTGTQLQINDADLALAQSRWNQLTAVYDYHVSIAELEQLLGERYQLTDDGGNVRYSQK